MTPQLAARDGSLDAEGWWRVEKGWREHVSTCNFTAFSPSLLTSLDMHVLLPLSAGLSPGSPASSHTHTLTNFAMILSGEDKLAPIRITQPSFFFFFFPFCSTQTNSHESLSQTKYRVNNEKPDHIRRNLCMEFEEFNTFQLLPFAIKQI